MTSAYKNFAYSTVATAPSPASSGTSLVVAAAAGANFPTPPFNLTIWPSGSQPTTTNAEIATVTAVSTDTFTITRAQEGTSARTVVIGDQIAATLTANVADMPQTNTAPAEDVFLAANYSSVVLEEYAMDATHELVFADPSEMWVA
jgi:hypothetical protein